MTDRAALFRTLGDATRLRILALLDAEELSVGELQDILGLGQSTVSGHLAQLRRVGLVATRKEGSVTRSTFTPEPGLEGLLGGELADADRAALDRVLAAREAPPPEGLGADYLPGRSWEAFAHLLLALMPAIRVADLGVGTGNLTRLLATRASHVIAVDRDAAALARVTGGNIEGRLGTLEELPLATGEVDVVVLSQSLHFAADPEHTLRQCRQALAPGGRVVVLDLAPHAHEWVRHRLGHLCLGFEDLGGMLTRAGFAEVNVSVAHVDRRSPSFTTMLATGVSPTDEAKRSRGA